MTKIRNSKIKILAIESSCDETAAAVISAGKNNEPVVLSNIVSSQIDLHAKTGGVVPEVASRAHMEAIMPVIEEALEMARNSQAHGNRLSVTKPVSANVQRCTADQRTPCNDTGITTVYRKPNTQDLLEDITHITVTAGPGLIGSLLVGFNAAKSLAYAKNLPIIPINHIEGHIYSAFAEEIRNPKSEIRDKDNSVNIPRFDIRVSNFPMLALVVSGGHTSLIYAKSEGKYRTIGETLDDAAGEAFDKVAKLLNLGYPGGPEISAKAEGYRAKDIVNPTIFPRPLLKKKNYDFSFSGLKTAVLREVINTKYIDEEKKKEISAAFEDSVVDVLVTKTMNAANELKPKTVVLAGGVSANKKLREVLKEKVDIYCSRTGAENFSHFSKNKQDIQLLMPPFELCGDNAAMIGMAAYFHIKRGEKKDLNEINIDSNSEL